jgi:hypothetical protein
MTLSSRFLAGYMTDYVLAFAWQTCGGGEYWGSRRRFQPLAALRLFVRNDSVTSDPAVPVARIERSEIRDKPL